MKKIFLLSSLFLALGAAGCVSIGEAFVKNHQTPQIVVGKTTKMDILKTYKQPVSVGTEDGDETWTYVDYHASILSGWTSDYLFVRFAKNGTVKSYNYSHGSSEEHGPDRY
jgi:hypothetical protein